MKIAVMQPYFFPYIGYFQLINSVDEYVVYDNIKFTKKGWINRNRILVSGKDEYISLPLKNDSDYLQIKDRYLSDSWDLDKKKMVNRIIESYRNAPHFNNTFALIERCIFFNDKNLFNFLYHSIQQVNEFLGINTKLTISSTIETDHSLKAEEKVIAICKAQNATIYINTIGGMGLYSKDNFINQGIELQFLEASNVLYKQHKNDFIPWLSIIDVMMFNDKDEVRNLINNNFTLN